MFNVDWTTVVNWLMPIILRTEFHINSLLAYLKPFFDVYAAFTAFRNDNIYKLAHSGQVCYLEAALNDAFDNNDRRIYIEDGDDLTVPLLQRDSDGSPFVLQTDAVSAFILHNDAAYNTNLYDFVIIIPFAFSDSVLFQLKAIVDFYKLAGKRYITEVAP